MPEERTIQEEVANALRAVATEPTSTLGHKAFFELLPKIHAAAGPDASQHLMGLWFEASSPGGAHLEAIERLAQTDRARDLSRFAGMMMIRTGYLEESVAAFSNSCADLESQEKIGWTTPEIRAKFEAIASDYDEVVSQRLTANQFVGFLEDAIPFRPAMRVLDVGCGTGLVAERIKSVVEVIDGVDISPEMVEMAQRKEIYDSLEVADACEAMSDPRRQNQYDLIICNWCIFYMPDLADFFRAAKSALAPGGRLALSAYPCSDQWDVLAKDELEYAHSRRYLSKLAEANHLGVERIDIRLLCIHPGYFCVFSMS